MNESECCCTLCARLAWAFERADVQHRHLSSSLSMIVSSNPTTKALTRPESHNMSLSDEFVPWYDPHTIDDDDGDDGHIGAYHVRRAELDLAWDEFLEAHGYEPEATITDGHWIKF